MSRLISEILNIRNPSFFHRIEELEHLSGRPGLDIKLAGELRLLFKEKARILGLDENDTTAKELYFSMLRRALDDSEGFAKPIGVKPGDTPRQMVEKSISYVEKRIGKKTVWSLKSNIARKQLKENPPKKLMKIFGIRSIGSALKRERVPMFYCFARLVEAAGWFSKYASQAGKLTNSDFDNQPIKISILAENRQTQLAKEGIRLNQIVYCDQESADIEVCVPDERFAGDVLFVVDSLLSQLKNMLRRSAYYKNQSLMPDFFSKVEKIRLNGFRIVEDSNQTFDWPTLVHAATELGISGLLEGQEPHIAREELLMPSTAQLAGFDFWKHPYGAYKSHGIVISFNLSDMIVNAINDIAPEQAYIENGRASLKNELFARYLEHESVQQKELLRFGGRP